MSNRSYPRVGSQRKHKPQKGQKRPLRTPPCAVCSVPSTCRVEVEVNWFRGDDETVNACDAHKNDAPALLAAHEAAVAATQRSAA